MPAPKPHVIVTPAVYDWKRTLVAAAKVGGYAAAGVVIADQAGLTAYLSALLPPEFAAIGGIVIAAVFAAARNWLANRQRGL